MQLHELLLLQPGPLCLSGTGLLGLLSELLNLLNVVGLPKLRCGLLPQHEHLRHMHDNKYCLLDL